VVTHRSLRIRVGRALLVARSSKLERAGFSELRAARLIPGSVMFGIVARATGTAAG